ncbi:MAG TPA: serine/threonine-protein kinase, partial [Isosphaeraceae bacterium]|nr:serine/threonine-protein kinase [Isosphaeraceae bacterium]
PYYAMRFIRGDSLKETIDQFHGEPGRVSAGSPGEPGRVSAGSRSRKTRGANATPLALRKLLRRFLDVCNAIDYAHSRGVIHRDIKPANIIVGKYGETLVVDWGLAKATGRVEPGTESGERVLVPSSAGGSAVTLPGSAMGTPAYMSPEQAEGQLDRLGRRSDVYSLGATLYCLLTGQPPFTGDVIDVIRAVQRGDFRPLRQLDPNIDPALEAICLKAMAHKPEDRYASCRALADDLERWMADEPVMAWREPFSRRARRWARRNRTAVTAVAVALVAGVVGLSAVLAVQTRANGQLSAALGRETVAKTALAASNVELIRSRAAVESRFDLAMDAVKSYTTGASEDVLLREEKFKDLRGKLLGGALAFYRRLEDELAAEVDPRSRTALARAFSEVGELTSKVGSKEEALKAHRRALDARQALAIEGGAVALADVASSHRAIGDLLRETGRRDQALVEYEKGRAVLKAAGLDGEHDERVRVEQVKLLRCVGWLLGETGRRPEGLATLREAVTAQETLAALRPNDRAIQADLPALTLDVGTLFLNEGRLDDALAEYRRSQALFARLVEADPANDRYRRDLACASENVGIVLFNQGRVAEALAAFEEHLPARRAAAKANPTAILYQADLATSLNNLGFLQTRAQQPQRALKSMDEARGILEDLSAANPTAIDLRRQLAKCLNDYGYQLSELDRISEA